jgi:hypothetical protein
MAATKSQLEGVLTKAACLLAEKMILFRRHKDLVMSKME